MVAKLAPETLSRRLRGWLAIAVIPLGSVIYVFAMIQTAPTQSGGDVAVPAQIVAFGLRERDPTGASARIDVVVRTGDGRIRTMVGDTTASRCKVGQRISVLRAQTAGGFERWSLPDAPCG